MYGVLSIDHVPEQYFFCNTKNHKKICWYNVINCIFLKTCKVCFHENEKKFKTLYIVYKFENKKIIMKI